MKIILTALLMFLLGCAAPKAPYHYGDSGRMARQMPIESTITENVVMDTPESVWK